MYFGQVLIALIIKQVLNYYSFAYSSSALFSVWSGIEGGGGRVIGHHRMMDDNIPHAWLQS